MPRRQSKSCRASVNAREFERAAFALRKAGATYEQIGSQLGKSKVAAYKAVTKVLSEIGQETRGDAVAVMELELARLDELLLGIWDRARRGEPELIDRALKIMHRRALFLGLDAPAKSHVEHAIKTAKEMTDEELLVVVSGGKSEQK